MKLIVICQIVDTRSPTVGFFIEWLKEFARQCEEVKVFGFEVGAHDLPKNVIVTSAGKEAGTSYPVRLFRLWKFLWRTLPNSDGVFVHMSPEYAIAAWPLVKLRRKPMVLWYAHKAVSLGLKLAVACVDRVLTASKESFRLASSKVMVVGHGIPAHTIASRTPHQDFRLLTVGRVSSVKHLEVLVRAVERCSGQPKTTLTIVGAPVTEADHAYETSLVNDIRARALDQRVTLVGALPYERVWELFAAHDLFVHASETGSLDKVILEAMMGGLPVVTSSEAFADLDASMRFPKGDDAALAERIRTWQRTLEQHPNAGHQLAEHTSATHGLPQLIRRIVSVFRSDLL